MPASIENPTSLFEHPDAVDVDVSDLARAEPFTPAQQRVVNDIAKKMRQQARRELADRIDQLERNGAIMIGLLEEAMPVIRTLGASGFFAALANTSPSTATRGQPTNGATPTTAKDTKQ